MADTSLTLPGSDTTRPRAHPARRGLLVAACLLAGCAVAVLWSAQLVDDDIGVNTASGMLGHNALTTAISGGLAGLVFAFTAGLAGTFTACNAAVFSALAPMMAGRSPAARRLPLAPLGWLTLGAAVVAGGYGAIGAVVGTGIPQLSTATAGGVPVRLLQSVIVFSVAGLVMLYLGLSAAGMVADPLAGLTARWQHVPTLVMGMVVGAFLIGRPYPLFYKMFVYAASTHDAAYGALSFILVVLGNIALVALVFLVLSLTPFPRWLAARPGRQARLTAGALLVAGAFTAVYWGVRVPAAFGYGWFPAMPWH